MQIPPGSDSASSRADVDPVAINVIRFGDNVTEVDPNPKGDAFVLNRFRVAISHCSLHFGGAADCIHNTRKFREQAVAGVLHDAAVVLRDFRIHQFPEMGLEPFVCALFVRTHQPGIPCHIGGKDRGEAARRGHG